jgi:putative transposase
MKSLETNHTRNIKPWKGDSNHFMPQSFVSLHCHLVFSTKHRSPMIDGELQPRLFEYIGGIARGLNSMLIAAGGIPDHVHLLVSLNKEIAISDYLREIKAESSKWIHKTLADKHEFAWQAGYGAFAVSYSQIDAVKAYIENQHEHHRTRTFQEEFVQMLKKHRIPFEERYLWD